MRAGRHLPTIALVVALFLVLTCAYTWPLMTELRSVVPHDRGDPLLVTWILWWSTKTIPLTAQWWNAPAFYPATGVFAFSENLLSLAPLTAPILVLTKTPVLAYNAAFIASYVLCGLGAYFLGFVLTSRHDAALVAGVAFAFAPYRLSHTNHLQLLSAYWMPVALAALHLFIRMGRTRAAALFAIAWAMQSLASGYYLVFLSLLVFLWLAWFRISKRPLAVLVGCWLVAAILLLPVFVGYRSIHARYGFKRSPVEIAYYSADIAGLFSASTDSLMWGRLHAVDQAESELFPGLTICIVVACGVVMLMRNRRGSDRRDANSAILFYVTVAVVMWLLALGPRPSFMGRPLGIYGPYGALMHLPGFDEMRVPARLWMLSILSLSATAALIVASVRSPALRRTVALVAIAGFLLDGWPRTFALAEAPALRSPTGTPAVARLGLPLARNETESMYQTIGDGLPVFNGYSGYDAPQHAPLRDLLERHDPVILPRLAAGGPIQIVVERALDPDDGWRRYVEQAGARLVDSGPGWNRYELPKQPRDPQPVVSGRPLTVTHADASVNIADVNAMFDGDLNTRWHAPHQAGSETITIDLGTPQNVAWVELCLGTYASQYPRSLLAEASLDGQSWTTAWSGQTALMTYDAAITNPRAIPIPLRIHRAARFLRFRQVANEPTRVWTIVELRVLGE